VSLGLADRQGDLLDDVTRFCDETLPEASIYRLLHVERDRLFPDEMFADLFKDTGRRSVPPSVVATVMVLQRLEGLSDRDAVERYAFDTRWRYAAGVGGYDCAGWDRFAHTVLVDFRARLAASDDPLRIFHVTLDAAGKAGLVGPKRFAPADRAFLAALLHRLPRKTLDQIRLVVRPDTVLRWHRDLIAAQHARISRPKRIGRPRTVRSIRQLVLRLARENDTWGYRRIHGELLVLGIKVAASTVWAILHDAGINPAPQRSSQTWSTFVRSQAEAIIAADFFETVTLVGTRMYVLAVIEHATRRVRILGATAHPTAAWVTQTARNLAMDLQDAGSRARFLIRDRDAKYPALFDTILGDAGITAVLSGVRMPRMNAIMERWIQTCRRELLDRTLVWNQTHLLHALRQYERHYNQHQPHRGVSNSRPLYALPQPIADATKVANLAVRRRDLLGGTLHEYEHAA
jgi:transposase InsO family protein